MKSILDDPALVKYLTRRGIPVNKFSTEERAWFERIAEKYNLHKTPARKRRETILKNGATDQEIDEMVLKYLETENHYVNNRLLVSMLRNRKRAINRLRIIEARKRLRLDWESLESTTKQERRNEQNNNHA